MMTIQERQKRAMMKKRKQIAKRRMILLLAALFVITLGSVVFGTIFSKAKNPSADIPQKTVLSAHAEASPVPPVEDTY